MSVLRYRDKILTPSIDICYESSFKFANFQTCYLGCCSTRPARTLRQTVTNEYERKEMVHFLFRLLLNPKTPSVVGLSPITDWMIAGPLLPLLLAPLSGPDDGWPTAFEWIPFSRLFYQLIDVLSKKKQKLLPSSRPVHFNTRHRTFHRSYCQRVCPSGPSFWVCCHPIGRYTRIRRSSDFWGNMIRQEDDQLLRMDKQLIGAEMTVWPRIFVTRPTPSLRQPSVRHDKSQLK